MFSNVEFAVSEGAFAVSTAYTVDVKIISGLNAFKGYDNSVLSEFFGQSELFYVTADGIIFRRCFGRCGLLDFLPGILNI